MEKWPCRVKLVKKFYMKWRQNCKFLFDVLYLHTRNGSVPLRNLVCISKCLELVFTKDYVFFLFIRLLFWLKLSRKRFSQVVSSSFLINPLKNLAEYCSFVFKATGKFSGQNLPVCEKILLHENLPTLLALFSFRCLIYWFLLGNSQQIDLSLCSVPVKALND